MKYRNTHPHEVDTNTPLPRILFNESVVFADFTFEELIRIAMPLTDWWKWNVAGVVNTETWSRQGLKRFVENVENSTSKENYPGGYPRLLAKLISIVGAIECDREGQPSPAPAQRNERDEPLAIDPIQVEAFCNLVEDLTIPSDNRGLLYGVSMNRVAKTSIW